MDRRLAGVGDLRGVYLLYTPLQWAVLFDFHPVTLATPLLLWCVWAVEADRPVLVGVFAALSVLTKEEVGIAVAALGLWVLIRHGRTRMAAALIIGGLMWSFIAIAIIIPYFSPPGGARSSRATAPRARRPVRWSSRCCATPCTRPACL